MSLTWRIRLGVAAILWTSVGVAQDDDEKSFEKARREAINEARMVHWQPTALSPTDDALTRALKARFNAALEQLQTDWPDYFGGFMKVETLLRDFDSLQRSGRELFTGAALVRFMEDYRQFAECAERAVHQRFEAGVESKISDVQANYLRHDAEIQLLRARRDAKVPGQR